MNKLTMTEIKEIIEKQKQKWLIHDFSGHFDTEHFDIDIEESIKDVRNIIECDFLSENDICDRSEEFSEDVDYDEVAYLRADTMREVIDILDLN